MSKETTNDKRPDWLPQEQRKEDGVHLTGKASLPTNHRLRAEALALAGETMDPDGIIGDHLIADTAERLSLEAAAAGPVDKPLAEQSFAELKATAKAEGVPRYGLIRREDKLRAAIEAHRLATAPAALEEKAPGDTPGSDQE
jgi:hypothetical protein